MDVTVRFAPSPTGLLHLGNARTALLNWLFAKQHGGRFILRLDDTDRERSTEAFAAAIVEDLAWLGILPDAVVRQIDRADRHADAAARLERRRRLRRVQGLPPIYDRAALRLSEADKARLEAEGRAPHWRFLLPNFDLGPQEIRAAPVGWDDLVRGRQTVDLGSLSDPILVRADGSFPYTLPSVVDDVELGITHVIRGEDHVANTAVQIAIFEALGAAAPAFGHHNFLTDADGAPLSKRTGALSLRDLRQAGYEPLAVAALAVLTGTAEAVTPVTSLGELAGRVSLDRISRAPARIGEGDLDALNAATLGMLPYEATEERLAPAARLGATFWETVRGNLARLADATEWARIVRDGPPPAQAPHEPAERAFLAAAAELLPPEPWDETTFKRWTTALATATGHKGRALYRPIRLALTGREDGPELARLLPLIGRRGTLARLSAP
jgi:glutamyl-tRNA synthetase